MKRGKTSLQLLEGETASQSGLHVVLLRGAVDNGAEQSAGGARSDRGSLRLAEQSAASLLSGLIEPGLHTLIPVLLEVGIRQNVVVLHFLHASEISRLVKAFQHTPTYASDYKDKSCRVQAGNRAVAGIARLKGRFRVPVSAMVSNKPLYVWALHHSVLSRPSHVLSPPRILRNC